MNLDALVAVIRDSTQMLRKGPREQRHQVGCMEVIEIIDADHVDEHPELQHVDVHFFVVGVDREKIPTARARLVELLREYPQPERLRDGPSYIELGGHLGDQGIALLLIGLGDACGLWHAVTPATVGISGPKAEQLAGSGFVMMSGYSS